MLIEGRTELANKTLIALRLTVSMDSVLLQAHVA